MMTPLPPLPVEPHELSGLIDGELSPQRAAEVRAALDADPALRAEYERLASAHLAWADAADAATFAPTVRLPTPRAASPLLGAAAMLSLLAVRFVPKFLPPLPAIALLVAAFAVALAAVLSWSLRTAAAAQPLDIDYRRN